MATISADPYRFPFMGKMVTYSVNLFSDVYRHTGLQLTMY